MGWVVMLVRWELGISSMTSCHCRTNFTMTVITPLSTAKTMPNQDPVQYEQQVDNSLSSSWVSSGMMESIKIGKGDKPVMGDIFQADWMSENASHTLPTLSISSLALTQAPAPAPASVATDNATAVAWTFGHCPLIIPDQSFEGTFTHSLS